MPKIANQNVLGKNTMDDARKGRGAGNGGAAYMNSSFWDSLAAEKKNREQQALEAEQSDVIKDIDD
ncbi:MAG: hypothetical protein ACRC3J_05275 [Culicoidibacterales bacterium]